MLQTLRDLGAGPVADPVLATGRLALTAYTLQILWLALLSALATAPRTTNVVILGSEPRRRRRRLLGARPVVGHRPAGVGRPPPPHAAAGSRTDATQAARDA